MITISRPARYPNFHDSKMKIFQNLSVWIKYVANICGFNTNYIFLVTSYNILLAFSFYSNFKKLLTIVPQKNDNNSTITSLNGLRVISIAWIIYCHSNMLALVYPALNSADELEVKLVLYILLDLLSILFSTVCKEFKRTACNGRKYQCRYIFVYERSLSCLCTYKKT